MRKLFLAALCISLVLGVSVFNAEAPVRTIVKAQVADPRGILERLESCTTRIDIPGAATGARFLTYNTNDDHIYGTSSVSGNIFDINPVTNAFVRQAVAADGADRLLGIAYAPNTDKLYVAENQNEQVGVFNADTLAGITSITRSPGAENSRPHQVEYISSTGEIYVTDPGFDDVWVIDTTSDSRTDVIAVGADPVGMAYDSTTDQVFIANLAGNTVSVIDPATQNVDATISVGASPNYIAYDSVNEQIFVSHAVDVESPIITVIDPATNAVVATVTGIAPDPTSYGVIDYNANIDRVYVITSSIGGLDIHVIDPHTYIFVGSINSDNTLQDLFYVSAVSRTYYTDFGSNDVCSMSLS